MSNISSVARFKRSLSDPESAQRGKLADYLRRNLETAFGRRYEFHSIRSYDEFAKRVPLSSYEDLVPWIDRIRRGEESILTQNRITHFAPTSGSSGGCKLIPFTRELQGEFSGAVGVWMSDLFAKTPSLRGGRAYWSVTPVTKFPQELESAVPIGFEEDSDYLGGFSRRIVDTLMAVPGSVRHAESMEAFWHGTALALLRCEDLRLISVWHPSFLTILWEYIQAEKKKLSQDLKATRADRLKVAEALRQVWPDLALVSCWGDAGAAEPFRTLERDNPDIAFQRKGLIATEGFVSIPYEGAWPLAIDTHFFEFIDSRGEVLPAQALEAGQEYEVVLTNAGGLWRYRLGDRIRVEGLVRNTPTVRFIGRAGVVSDLFGEKLSEGFVGNILQEMAGRSAFAMLAPDGDRYTLYIEGAAPDAAIIECALCANPHYRYCRELGQLNVCRVYEVAAGAHVTFIRRMSEMGLRLGDIKPASLSKLSGWSDWFRGRE